MFLEFHGDDADVAEPVPREALAVHLFDDEPLGRRRLREHVEVRVHAPAGGSPSREHRRAAPVLVSQHHPGVVGGGGGEHLADDVAQGAVTADAVRAIRADDEVERRSVGDGGGHLPVAPPVPRDADVARRVDGASRCAVARGVVLGELEQRFGTAVGEHHARRPHRGCGETHRAGAAPELEHGRALEAQGGRVVAEPPREDRGGAPDLPAGAVPAAPPRSFEVQPERRGVRGWCDSAPATRCARGGRRAATRRDERGARHHGRTRGARGAAHLGSPAPLAPCE